MRVLKGRIPENTAGNKAGGRQLAVSKALQWNTGRETHTIKWKEVESRRMGYENLQWRRKLISDTVRRIRAYTYTCISIVTIAIVTVVYLLTFLPLRLCLSHP